SNFWNPQDCRRQYLSVSHDHDHVRREGANLLDGVWIFDFRRLKNRHLAAGEGGFNWRRGNFLFAPDRFVRLRNDAHKLVLWFLQRVQRGHSDFAGADENNAHDSSGRFNEREAYAECELVSAAALSGPSFFRRR